MTEKNHFYSLAYQYHIGEQERGRKAVSPSDDTEKDNGDNSPLTGDRRK